MRSSSVNLIVRAAITFIGNCTGVDANGDPRQWYTYRRPGFDNIFLAMQTLLEVSTTEGWVDVMDAAIDGYSVRPLFRRRPVGLATLCSLSILHVFRRCWRFKRQEISCCFTESWFT